METDFGTVDGVIKGLYQSVSFGPSAGPDYELMRLLFHPQGRITPPKEDTNGSILSMNVGEFITTFDNMLNAEGIIETGGREVELERRTFMYKRTAHVLSSYKFFLADKEPVARGVNSFQLVQEVDRWWILHLTWDRAEKGEPMASLREECNNSHYQQLQVDPGAETPVIRHAFRYLGNKYHPDNGNTGDAKLFREITEAWRVLSDGKKRAEYDRSIGIIRFDPDEGS